MVLWFTLGVLVLLLLVGVPLRWALLVAGGLLVLIPIVAWQIAKLYLLLLVLALGVAAMLGLRHYNRRRP